MGVYGSALRAKLLACIALWTLFLSDCYSALALETGASSSFRRKLLADKPHPPPPPEYDTACGNIPYCNNCTDPDFGYGNNFKRDESKKLPWLGLVVNTVARTSDVDYLTMTLESVANALSPDPTDPLGPEDIRVSFLRLTRWN
jgi:hypothetical protein